MAAKEEEILKKYLPERSISYCLSLWESHRIQFLISRPRKSVYGNYLYRNGVHHISVNGDLPPEAFLVTYLHEVAHLVVRVKYRRRVKPHGPEWQAAFRQLMEPVLIPSIFSDGVLRALKEHMIRPGATSCSDPFLHRLLMETLEPGGVLISDLEPGSVFRFRGSQYQWIRLLRKRVECRSLDSGLHYRFLSTARVEPIAASDGMTVPSHPPKLSALSTGAYFRLGDKAFQVVEKKRTRFVCREVSGGRLYLIPEAMPVEEFEV